MREVEVMREWEELFYLPEEFMEGDGIENREGMLECEESMKCGVSFGCLQILLEPWRRWSTC